MKAVKVDKHQPSKTLARHEPRVKKDRKHSRNEQAKLMPTFEKLTMAPFLPSAAVSILQHDLRRTTHSSTRLSLEAGIKISRKIAQQFGDISFQRFV